MRSPISACALLILLPCTFSIFLPSTTNPDSLNAQRAPSLPFQTPPYSRPQGNPSLFTIVRDGIIHKIWGPPSSHQSIHGTCKSTAPQSTSPSIPPPTVLARYGEDVVLRFQISSPEEAKALAEATNVLFLDVWEFTAEWVDIRLAKDVVSSLLGLLPSSLHRAHTPLMHDLAQTIFESYPSPAFAYPDSAPREGPRGFNPSLRTTPDESNIFFQQYQPLSVIVPWMRLLNSLFPTHVRMVNIGISYEGRDIPALRVGVHPTNAEKPQVPRKSIIITGGSHAREWISTSTVNYVAYSLITAYGKSKSMTNLVKEFDWIFIPTLNPDGYVYTWENDRLWRKNRQQTNLRFCKGLDLDRAYGFEWDGEISKSNPCSESFSGDGPFQAAESRRFANWVKNETENNNLKVVGFLDFHSYSQQILYPYSYSCTSAPPTLENLEELAIGLAKAIRLVSGENYGVTSACEGSVTLKQKKGGRELESWPRIETGGGSALDWFYHEMHVKNAYQIKLRDTGSYGFLLPSKHIVPTGEEAFSAVTYFGNFLLGNKGIELAKEEDAGLESEKLDDAFELTPFSGDIDTTGSETTLPRVFNKKAKDDAFDGRDDNDEEEEGEEEEEEEESINLELRR